MPAGVAEKCMTEEPETHGSNPAEVHLFFPPSIVLDSMCRFREHT